MKKTIISIGLMFMTAGTFLAKSATKVLISQDLFSVVKAGDRKAVKKILISGVSVNTLNDQGKTALDIAVERGNFKIAKDLCKCGAKVTTELNAQKLKHEFQNRGIRFLITGFFFTPLLWIGTYTSSCLASNVTILQK